MTHGFGGIKEPRYVLNRNAGTDTLHVEHPWEVCNVDDAKDSAKIDGLTAKQMIENGQAVACQHCQPQP